MKRLIYLLFFLFIICAANNSCVKPKNFPNQPIIEFKEADKFESHFVSHTGSDSIFLDSLYVIIKFTDGDGDIGIVAGDTTSKDDFQMKYLYKDVNGNFVPYNDNLNVNPFDTFFVSYRVPDITPKGQYKALQGEINARLKGKTNSGYPNVLFIPTHTSIKYEITLRDRAGNVSNKVTSTEIIVP